MAGHTKYKPSNTSGTNMIEQFVFKVVDTTPFKEGKAAGEKSIRIEIKEKFTNPYPQGSNEWVEWICGYNQAIWMF